VAVAFIDGHVGEHQFTDTRVRDPEVVALSDRVTATVDDGVAPDEVYIDVKLRDGRTFHKHVAHALGSLERPLTDGDLERKFHDLAEGILPRKQTDELIALCWALPELEDASQIARAAAIG
jgi:2-methylcitrate dehydratase PrpD